MLGAVGEMVGTRKATPCGGLWEGIWRDLGFPWWVGRSVEGVWWCYCCWGGPAPRDWCDVKQWFLPKLGRAGVNLGSTGGWLAKPAYQTWIGQSWVLNVKLCLTEAGDRWAPRRGAYTGLLFAFLGLRKKWASSQTLKTSLLFAFPETWDKWASG